MQTASFFLHSFIDIPSEVIHFFERGVYVCKILTLSTFVIFLKIFGMLASWQVLLKLLIKLRNYYLLTMKFKNLLSLN